MKLWDESKHPRDTDGKFRKVGLMEGMGENDIDESQENFGERKKNLVYTRKPDNKINLSNQEWAIWYSKIGEIKRGYAFKKDKQGNYLLPIESKYGESKIIVTKYNYENPKIVTVEEFKSNLNMYDYLKINGDLL